jgi:Acetyltransferase (isoleucine patch superfamily)
MFDFLLDRLATLTVNAGIRIKQRHLRRHVATFPDIDRSVAFGPNVIILAPPGSVSIGCGSYINDGILSASEECPLRIGERCAIGYRVSIKAVTHDLKNPAPDATGAIAHKCAPITIGDRCWIGDNVFLREGITLGDDVVVGANSVVTKSFPSGSVVAGVPAKLIR